MRVDTARACIVTAMVGLFSVLFLFFYKVNPTLPVNGDDWACMLNARYEMWPTFNEWNPARVFPEVIYPLWGLFSAYVVSPLVGDYIQSFIISRALVLALSLTVLCFYFYKMAVKLLALEGTENPIASDKYTALLCMFIFISFLFFLFKSEPESVLLFQSVALNTDFYYVIPHILNGALLCILLYFQYGPMPSLALDVRTGFLFLAVYFAQFSITYSSLILASYAGASLLFRFFAYKGRILQLYRERTVLDGCYVFILVLWGVAAAYDISGDRYGALTNQGSFAQAIDILLTVFTATHYNAQRFIGLVFLLFFISAYKNRARSGFFIRTVLALLLACAVTFSADVCIFVVTGLDLARPEVFYNGVFLLVMALMFALVYLVKTHISARFLLPWMAVFFLYSALYNGNTYKAVPTWTQAHQEMVASWVQTLHETTQKGDDSCVLYVPTVAWPYPEWLAESIPNALYIHGQIPYKPQVRLEEKKFHE